MNEELEAELNWSFYFMDIFDNSPLAKEFPILVVEGNYLLVNRWILYFNLELQRFKYKILISWVVMFYQYQLVQVFVCNL